MVWIRRLPQFKFLKSGFDVWTYKWTDRNNMTSRSMSVLSIWIILLDSSSTIHELTSILVIHAKIAMCFAWIVSFILWAPWIIGWQFIVNKRTVPENDCYIQFIQVNFDSWPMALTEMLNSCHSGWSPQIL